MGGNLCSWVHSQFFSLPYFLWSFHTHQNKQTNHGPFATITPLSPVIAQAAMSFTPSPLLPPSNTHHPLCLSHCPSCRHRLPLSSLLPLPSSFLSPVTLVTVAIPLPPLPLPSLSLLPSNLPPSLSPLLCLLPLSFLLPPLFLHLCRYCNCSYCHHRFPLCCHCHRSCRLGPLCCRHHHSCCHCHCSLCHRYHRSCCSCHCPLNCLPPKLPLPSPLQPLPLPPSSLLPNLFLPLPLPSSLLLPLLLPPSPSPSSLQLPSLLKPLPLSSLLHANKCNGNSVNTGNGVGNNIAGDKVGDGEGDKGNCHKRHCHCCHRSCLRCCGSHLHCCCCHHNYNAVALSAAIAAAVTTAHLFDTTIKWQWRG
jgi:hypothetical protein